MLNYSSIIWCNLKFGNPYHDWEAQVGGSIKGYSYILEKEYLKYFMLHHIWGIYSSAERFLMFYLNLEDSNKVKNH